LFRQFYRVFPIANALRSQLSWTQYRIERLPHEHPTIGILLCASKNDAVVKFTLPEDQKQIVASQYELYLPTEQQLLDEVNKELESFVSKVGDA